MWSKEVKKQAQNRQKGRGILLNMSGDTKTNHIINNKVPLHAE